MGQFVINYPDSLAADIRDTLSSAWGYQDTVNGAPNPETKAQFIKRMIAQHVKDVYSNAKASQAALTASDQAKSTANSVDIS